MARATARAPLLLLFIAVSARAQNFTAAVAVLQAAIAARVFPGCAAGVLSGDGAVLLSGGWGSQVYAGEAAPLGGNAAADAASLFDMASITKIIGATTATALLLQRGEIELDAPLSSAALLGPAFAGQGKAGITVRDCLLHQAGFPPDPAPGYSEAAFGCPAAAAQPTPPLNFSCAQRVLEAVQAQALAYPPRSAWLYSDLSMISLAFALGGLVRGRGLVPRAAGTRYGAALMLSMPPATTMSWCPSAMLCAASVSAFMPLAHTLFTVVHTVLSAQPAPRAAWRAGACPTPAPTTLPKITSCTSLGLRSGRRSGRRVSAGKKVTTRRLHVVNTHWPSPARP